MWRDTVPAGLARLVRHPMFGPKANGMEDEQCVKVQSVKIAGPDADTVLRDSLATLKK
jgi:hypothetical protein